MSPCRLCGGPLYLLRTLGNTRHFRCRDCGMDWSRTKRTRAERVWKQKGRPGIRGQGPTKEGETS